jgi:hypothetical protein
MVVGNAIPSGEKEPARSTRVNKSHPKRLWNRVVELLLEVLVAVVLVVVIVSAAVFNFHRAHAPWMPAPERIRQTVWSLAGFGFGVAFLYLAFSTRRLEQRLSNKPQLQQFITLSRCWFVYLAVSILFFTFGFWSLWPVLLGHKAIPPNLRVWSTPLFGFEMLTGLLWVLMGYGILELKLKLTSEGEISKVLSSDLITSLLAIGSMIYGAGKVIYGSYLFFK